MLVVDDSALTLDLTRSALEGAGFAVTTACGGDEVEALDPHAFDLILMDVQMPALYGDDIAAVLRHVRKAPARIFLVSGLSADELALRASEAGLDGHICKREGMDAIVARVKELLA